MLLPEEKKLRRVYVKKHHLKRAANIVIALLFVRYSPIVAVSALTAISETESNETIPQKSEQ